MKERILLSILGVMALVLVSCATTAPDTGGEKMAAEADDTVVSVENQGPVIMWKQARETVMFIDGTVDKTVEYSYDDEGRIFKITERNGRGELLYLRDYKYDGGNLVSQEMSDQFGLVSMTLYTSDAEGHVIEEVKQDSEGNSLSKVTFEYENNLVVMSVAYDGEGIPHLSARYEYQDETVTLVEYLLPGGRQEAVFERSLEDGRVMEEKTVLPDGTVETARKFTWNGDLLVSEDHYAEGIKMKSVRYDHDEYNNVIRETWSNRSGKDYEILERQWLRLEMAE